MVCNKLLMRLLVSACLMLVIVSPYALIGWRHTGLVDGSLAEVESVSFDEGSSNTIQGSIRYMDDGPVAGAEIAVTTNEGIFKGVSGADGGFVVNCYRRVVERIDIGVSGCAANRDFGSWWLLAHGGITIPEGKSLRISLRLRT